MAVEGTTDGAVFRAYVSQVLAPTLEPGDMVVIDGLAWLRTRWTTSAAPSKAGALP